MERRDGVNRAAGNLLNRAAHWLTDRRRFLTGAGKYGALLMGAAYIPGRSALETAYAQAATQGSDEMPVEQKKGAVRIMGVVQRRIPERAELRGEAWILNGSKAFITNASVATTVVVMRTSPIARKRITPLPARRRR